MKQLVAFLSADHMHYGPLAHDFWFIPPMKQKTAAEHNSPPDGQTGNKRLFSLSPLLVIADPKNSTVIFANNG